MRKSQFAGSEPDAALACRQSVRDPHVINTRAAEIEQCDRRPRQAPLPGTITRHSAYLFPGPVPLRMPERKGRLVELPNAGAAATSRRTMSFLLATSTRCTATCAPGSTARIDYHAVARFLSSDRAGTTIRRLPDTSDDGKARLTSFADRAAQRSRPSLTSDCPRGLLR